MPIALLRRFGRGSVIWLLTVGFGAVARFGARAIVHVLDVVCSQVASCSCRRFVPVLRARCFVCAPPPLVIRTTTTRRSRRAPRAAARRPPGLGQRSLRRDPVALVAARRGRWRGSAAARTCAAGGAPAIAPCGGSRVASLAVARLRERVERRVGAVADGAARGCRAAPRSGRGSCPGARAATAPRADREEGRPVGSWSGA